MLVLPPDFQKRILTAHGEPGRQWLKDLPNLIRSLEKEWQMRVGESVPHLSYGYVCTALRADGSEAICKITFPNDENRNGIVSFTALCGRHVVPVLEYDAKRCATLLYKITPGTPLHAIGDNKEETMIAAQLMRDIPVPVPKGSSWKTLRNWLAVFDRLNRSALPFPTLLLDRAQTLFEELDASKRGEKLLHGDLHHENILLNEKRGCPATPESCSTWTAIDPKGIIADPLFECARFLRNIWPSQKQNDLKTLLQERIEVLSEVLNADPKRIAGWGFIDCILSACWSVEDGEENWQETIRCAEILEKMFS